ncbi:MAG: WXG100 family type VII secretion target [Nocardioides sp.]
MTDGFTVDLDELARVVADVGAAEAAYELTAVEIVQRTAALHAAWGGAAADAHRLAQARWQAGFDEMRTALRALRAAATTAHEHYPASAEANLAMWEEVR